MTRSELHTGDQLKINESLVSPDGRTTLTLQPDGHLVVQVDGKFIWGSWTKGRGGTVLSLQPDGNLVLYTVAGVAVWASNTNHHDGATMRPAVQNDNNVVIYMNNYYV
ncbi:alpha-D-mannose-specific plant lectin [Bimuria novae-zelandiae CBS 107.79]|uniref:Alpha-D-mannose-specific plant lectin n=1 Tax=Bimuria novae-zelandiae CBS 107.79 TaxID=1447943 RepID=A0A6A5VW79_9PLEO|nr:alpha-D-mannose-specific plant lectin [Bimuria novae-zelandiae CBS 107.79]